MIRHTIPASSPNVEANEPECDFVKLEPLVAAMLERLGYELATSESAANLATTKDGHKYVVACTPPADFTPTSKRDLTRLHAAVVAANATAGFFVTSRTFTPEAEAYAATAPLKLVGGATLVASKQRSRRV